MKNTPVCLAIMTVGWLLGAGLIAIKNGLTAQVGVYSGSHVHLVTHAHLLTIATIISAIWADWKSKK